MKRGDCGGSSRYGGMKEGGAACAGPLPPKRREHRDNGDVYRPRPSWNLSRIVICSKKSLRIEGCLEVEEPTIAEMATRGAQRIADARTLTNEAGGR
jgi:hypothetical protein